MSVKCKIAARSSAPHGNSFDVQFSELPDHIAAPDKAAVECSYAPYWMMLLKYGERRNCEFWIASEADTGRVLARIAADIPTGRAEESSIGFFDCHDTVEGRAAGRELIHTAMQWLAARGAQAAVAPMDFNSWFNYRFKVREQSENKAPDKSWEPSAPDFHLALFKDEGFQDFIAFSSLEYEIASPEHWKAYIALMQPDFQAAVAHGYTLSPFASGTGFQDDLRDIFALATIAFAENPMFEEIPFELFAALTTGFARKSNMDASLICRAADGSVAGFAFCFTEGNELIYKTVAVHPDHRSKGLANALTCEISSYCLKNNIRTTTGALIRSGNRSERIGHKHGQFAKPSNVYNYILLRKSLS